MLISYTLAAQIMTKLISPIQMSALLFGLWLFSYLSSFKGRSIAILI